MISQIEGICGCGGSRNESTQYFYNAALNLVKKVDALSNETTYTYDRNNNLTAITDPTGTESSTYNTSGHGSVQTAAHLFPPEITS